MSNLSVFAKQKKVSPLLIIIGAALSGYLGYLIGGAWEQGMKFTAFCDAFNEVCDKPFANYLNGGTAKAMAFALMVYAIAIIMYLTSQRNLMPGKEYGTAAFAKVSQVNKILSDKEQEYNRVLSQNLKMSLNTRHTKLNNNVLIIGGSGAGKTFYEVKPNLMQMPHNCSFICTDPKGGARRSHLKRVSTARLNCFN